MDEVVKELEFAYKMISSIPVSGDAVDIMAAAKAKLRKAVAELKEKEGE
jgi:hypothetical protein